MPKTTCKLCNRSKTAGYMHGDYCKACLKKAVCGECSKTIGDAYDNCIVCKDCNTVYHGYDENSDEPSTCFAMSEGCCGYCIECEGKDKSTQPDFKPLLCDECWNHYICGVCYGKIIEPRIVEDSDEEDEDEDEEGDEPAICDFCNRIYHTRCWDDKIGDLRNCCAL